MGRIVLMLCMMAVAGCADESQRFRDIETHRQAQIAALVAEGSAASLATASLLSGRLVGSKSQSDEYIQRAIAMAPERPELVWMQWRLCSTRECAEEPQIRAHLKAVAPDNGLAWVPDLQEAWARESPTDVTQMVARIGAGRHMTTYWNVLTVMMVDSLGQSGRSPQAAVEGLDLVSRMGYVAGTLAAVGIPPLWTMAKACHLDQFDQPGRRAACEAMTARMQESDAVLMQSVAIALQENWWPQGSPQRQSLLAEHQQLQYLMMASSRLRPLHLNRDARTRIDAARRSGREIDVMRAMLVSFHEPLERPANWKDPSQRLGR